MTLNVIQLGEYVIFGAAVLGGLSVFWKYIILPSLTSLFRSVMKEELAEIKAEVTLNHGKSLKDAVVRIERRVNEIENKGYNG